MRDLHEPLAEVSVDHHQGPVREAKEGTSMWEIVGDVLRRVWNGIHSLINGPSRWS